MSDVFMECGLSFASATLSWLVTLICIRFALRRNLLDHPNERSSHSQAVPRVGGIGIFAGFAVPFLASSFLSATPQDHWWVVLLSGTGMASVGLLDDFRNLSASRKYLLQLGIVAGILWTGSLIAGVTLPFVGPVALRWLAVPLSLLWLTGFPNFFNFMDGTNGMAGGAALIYGIFFSAYAYLLGNPEVGLIGLLVASSSLGFLFHNFPRARTFMGDAGSLFLGITFALLAALIPVSFIASLLLCSVFIYDCVTTLVRRLARGENIFQAHRSHHYQRLAASGWGHTRVAILYYAMHIVAGILGLFYLFASDDARILIILTDLIMLGGLSLMVGLVERKNVVGETPVAGVAKA
jgi:UDP-N-acetylmuramyl pentapeptide phosphotransferase/UDP-N-acetylglucosamine-1-phosphate transferase